jgi:quercetin dioxygenase-like cupin family protein
MTKEKRNGAIVVDLDGMVEFAKEGIVSKTVADKPHAKIILFSMAAGQYLSEHTASMPAVIHVLRGRGEVKLGRKWHAVKPGAWVHMRTGLDHAVKAAEDLVFLVTLFRGEPPK